MKRTGDNFHPTSPDSLNVHAVKCKQRKTHYSSNCINICVLLSCQLSPREREIYYNRKDARSASINILMCYSALGEGERAQKEK